MLQLPVVFQLRVRREDFLLQNVLVQFRYFLKLFEQLGVVADYLGADVHFVFQHPAERHSALVGAPGEFLAVVQVVFGDGQLLALVVVVDYRMFYVIAHQVVFFFVEVDFGEPHLLLKVSDGAVGGAETEYFVCLDKLVL